MNMALKVMITSFHIECLHSSGPEEHLTLSGPGGGGVESAPPRFFLHNSKTPGDIEKKLTLTLHL